MMIWRLSMQMLRNELYRPWFANETDWGFEIIDGEYSGFVVQIESVEFSKTDESGLELKYHIINQPEYKRNDNTDELFSKTIELIINDILKEAIDHHESTRTDDPEKSDTQ